MSTIDSDNLAYERWLRRQCSVVEKDLVAKRLRMGKSPFDFLRATYYRWANTIESICPDLAGSPRCLCVGDIHVENFGTWRDADGRLVWGVNDFDEAAVMPYAYDLVRLAVSARLAGTLKLSTRQIATTILEGYSKGLEKPRPALLDEQDDWLLPLVAASLDASQKFWRDIDKWPDATPPPAVRKALLRCLPEGAVPVRFASRAKGGGSLGRPRYLVVAVWKGGRVVREAKALVPSGWHWAHPKSPATSRYLDVAHGGFRSSDLSIEVRAGHLLRRIAPDARKIELADVAGHGLDAKLLQTMAADLGAIHAAGKRRARIAQDLATRDGGWLEDAAKAAEAAVRRDFKGMSPD